MEIFFNYPMICVIMIFVFIPSPSVGIGAIAKMIGLTTYISAYFFRKYALSLEKHTINSVFTSLKEKFILGFSKLTKEILLLLIYGSYEILLLLFQPLSKSTVSYTIRPFFYIFLMLFSYDYFISTDKKRIKNELLKAIYIVFIIQYVISILQLFDINIFSFIYEDAKSFPLGFLVRLTGTFGNPNTFAWYISIFSVIVILLENRKKIKLSFIGIAIVFTLMTGSRTMIVLTPIMLLTTYVIQLAIVKKRLNILLYSVIAIPLMIVVMFLLLKILSPVLPYASQLLNVLDGGLSNVSSFNNRIIRWKEVSEIVTKTKMGWFFGARINEFPSTDNDILYGVFRSGIIGLILQYAVYIVIGYKSIKNVKKSSISLVVLVMVVFSMIVGFQADTLMGWYYPIFIFIFYGGTFIDIEYIEVPSKNEEGDY